MGGGGLNNNKGQSMMDAMTFVFTYVHNRMTLA